MRNRLRVPRPGLLASSLAVASLLSASRILVSGAYVSLWDLLWYSRPLPSILGILLFLAALLAGPGRFYPYLSGTALLAYALAGAATDDAHVLYVLAGPLTGFLLWTLQWTARNKPEAIPLGVSIDIAARMAAGGLEPWDHPYVSIVYALAMAYASLSLLLLPAFEKPGLPALLWLAVAGLGAAYPNAALHYFGVHNYGPLGYAASALTIIAGYTLGVLLPRVTAPVAMAVSGILAIAGFLGGPLWAALAGLGTTRLLAGSQPGGSALARLAWGLLFVGFMVAGVGVYAYPYLGLWPLADRMELVVFAALLAGVAYSLLRDTDAPRPPFTIARYVVGAFILGFIALAAQAGQPPPVQGYYTIVSYNLHQGYTWDGRFNGWETVNYLAQYPGLVACLQEVDAGRLTSAYMDLPLALRIRGIEVAYQPAIEGTYGVAVASGLPIDYYSGHLLTSTGEQRAAIKANAGGLIIVSAHLGLDPQERARQAQELLTIAAQTPTAHAVCGDFNEQQGQALDTIAEQYTLIPEPGEQPTCCLGEALNQTIDYIAYNPDRLTIRDYKIDQVDISDHLPIIAQAEKKPTP